MKNSKKSIFTIIIIICMLFNNITIFSAPMESSSLKEVEVIDLGTENKVYNQEIKDDEDERIIITKSGEIILRTTYYKANGKITQESIEMTEQSKNMLSLSEVDSFKKIVTNIITDESSYICTNIVDTRENNDSEHLDDLSKINPNYLRYRRGAGTKYLYQEIENTTTEYVVYLEITNDSYTTWNMAGAPRSQAQINTAKACERFWNGLGSMNDAMDSIFINAFGLVPGVGTVINAIDIYEQFNSGSYVGAIGTALISVLRASLGPADYFYTAAELSAYSALYFGHRTTLKDTYYSVVGHSEQI